jgi:hypothetical protein
MAPELKIALALMLAGSMLLAYVGPPPPWRVALRLRGLLLGTGLFGYALATLALAADAAVAGAFALLLASELVCAAGWLGRGDAPPADEDDDEGGGGGGGGGPKQPPPIDWNDFERAFGRYARERERQPV